MKTHPITSIASPITPVATIVFLVLMSALLLAAQVSAADPVSSGLAGSVQENIVIDKSLSLPERNNVSVNINEAGANTLSESLKGIGLKKAEAIVEWRNINGNFVELEQLLKVKGIGEKILLANRHKMTL